MAKKKKKATGIKWLKLLLELLVVFAGVTAGFLLNNLREESVNREFEQIYLENLLINLSADSIEQGLIIGSTGATDVITVSYSHVDGDTAIATVNASIDAYAEVSKAVAQGTVAAAIAELDQAIAEFESAWACAPLL